MINVSAMSTRIGRFQILDKTNDGPIGAIFRANDPISGRIVAVETAQLSHQLKPELRERAVHEARSAGALNHPNIAAILDVGVDNDVVFIAREFVDGPTLAAFVDESGPFEPDTVLPWFEQMAAAIDHAHQRSVIHGRLNPSNILFTKSGQIKLTGFGVARIQALAEGGAKASADTKCYLSPEQVKGEAFDRKSDIFSLGAIAFELFAGACPFESDSVVSTIFKVVYEAAPTPSSIRPGLLPGLDAAILKSLEKAPEARYQTGAEFYTAVRRVVRPQVATGPLLGIPVQPESGPGRFCDQCGERLVQDARFCFSCGAASVAVEVAVPYEQPHTVPEAPEGETSNPSFDEPETIDEISPRRNTPAQPFGAALVSTEAAVPRTEVVSAARVAAPPPVGATERVATQPIPGPTGSVPPPLSGYAKSAGADELPAPGADLSQPKKKNVFLTLILPLTGFLIFLVGLGVMGYVLAPLIMQNPFRSSKPPEPPPAPVEEEKYPGAAPFATQLVPSESSGVENGDNALGPPDARFAVVAPGGTLVATLNSGYVLKDDGTDAPEFSVVGFIANGTATYTIFVHKTDGSFVELEKASGFSPHDLKKAKVDACDGFKIVNTGKEPFKVDSIQLKREPEPKDSSAPAPPTSSAASTGQ